MELAAARSVTALLDGQGGDELLVGYHPCFDYYWGGLLLCGQWPDLGRELAAYHRRYGAPLPYLL
jgi:asparagine synthetase B (glutamine-hydrolysing)